MLLAAAEMKLQASEQEKEALEVKLMKMGTKLQASEAERKALEERILSGAERRLRSSEEANRALAGRLEVEAANLRSAGNPGLDVKKCQGR